MLLQAETEIRLLHTKGMFKRQITLDRRFPGSLPDILHFPDPPLFSLQSTFNKLKVLTWIKTGLLAFDWGHLLTFELRRSLAIYETWQQETYSRFFIII